MAKIVYNRCYGGFGLSSAALARYNEIAGLPKDNDCYICRTDPALIQVIEELGKAASDVFSDLCICELPTGTRYRIDNYDGLESVITIDDHD